MPHIIFSAIIGYLLGSVNGAQFLHRFVGRFKAIDPSRVGTKNSGTQNVWMSIGRFPALIVLAIDLPKAYIATVIGNRLFGLESAALLIPGLFAIIGHNWPIFFGFKGGRGGASLLGLIIAYNLHLAVIVFLVALPFVIIRVAGLTQFALLGGVVYLEYANAGVPLVLVSLLIIAVIVVRRVHAEWDSVKKSTQKLPILKNLILYDRPLANPPSLREIFFKNRKKQRL